mgnify:FL=1|tara:strand:- start:57 stop:383 length:327 start_codon:yes stop_codon:yes gene_type:complete
MAQILLNAVTATGVGTAWNPRDTSALATYVQHSFQAKGTVASTTGAAVILIEVSNDGTNYITLGTITLVLGTVATSDGFACANSWEYYRANVSSISGATATVTVYMKG